jgi:hypothetical protein
VHVLTAMAVIFMRRAKLTHGTGPGVPSSGWIAARILEIGGYHQTAVDWLPDDPIVTGPQALSAVVGDTQGDLLERVRVVGTWIQTGTFPGEDDVVTQLQRDRDEQIGLPRHFRIWDGGRIATIETTSRFAVEAGKRLAPIVIAINPQHRFPGARPHRTVTIVQREAGHVDLDAVAADLSAREPGWSGDLRTTIDSPQGRTSTISLETAMKIVKRHLLA